MQIKELVASKLSVLRDQGKWHWMPIAGIGSVVIVSFVLLVSIMDSDRPAPATSIPSDSAQVPIVTDTMVLAEIYRYTRDIPELVPEVADAARDGLTLDEIQAIRASASRAYMARLKSPPRRPESVQTQQGLPQPRPQGQPAAAPQNAPAYAPVQQYAPHGAMSQIN